MKFDRFCVMFWQGVVIRGACSGLNNTEDNNALASHYGNRCCAIRIKACRGGFAAMQHQAWGKGEGEKGSTNSSVGAPGSFWHHLCLKLIGLGAGLETSQGQTLVWKGRHWAWPQWRVGHVEHASLLQVNFAFIRCFIIKYYCLPCNCSPGEVTYHISCFSKKPL